jgi:hypothetical protein
VLKNATLFDQDNQGNYFVDPTDVKDNSTLIAESYFLGTLSAVATAPEEFQNRQNILNLFNSWTYNSAGLISANVYVRGIPTQITVDDYLPFITGTNKLAFS